MNKTDTKISGYRKKSNSFPQCAPSVITQRMPRKAVNFPYWAGIKPGVESWTISMSVQTLVYHTTFKLHIDEESMFKFLVKIFFFQMSNKYTG